MILEEYCSYILSRERENKDFTIPGCSLTIDKDELISNMRKALRDNSDKSFDYDGLLVNTMMLFVSKDYLGKIQKLDETMDAVLNNIRKRVEQISTLYKNMDRSFPFSYEKVFEILVYYLRLVTNILNTNKGQKACYRTAEISVDAVLYFFNRKLSVENLDIEWEKKGWDLLNKDTKPFYAGMVEVYIRFVLLATYIRYCEIKNN